MDISQREWYYGDEKCPYKSCKEPVRSHFHLSLATEPIKVIKIYHDMSLNERLTEKDKYTNGYQ